MKKHKSDQSKKSSSRKRQFGRTNPNHRYFMGLLKTETEEYLKDNKEKLLRENPEIYYQMINRKLPKKYQKKDSPLNMPVNAIVPPQSKLSKDELDTQMKKEAEERRIKENATREKQRKDKLEEERIERNRAAYLRESKYIGWTNGYDQGRWRSIHSEEYQSRYKKKKYEYY
ncbi:hypothetical protein OAO03_01475 [Candidatus Pelagibacter ubique]|nr:hypothetical protein [Candidatus Pelagibacter ubique]